MTTTNESFDDAAMLWEDVMGLASEYEADPTLHAWAERLLPISLQDGVFIAAARQKWTEQKIMKEYRSIIESFFEEITLEHITLQVIVDKNAQPGVLSANVSPAQVQPQPQPQPQPQTYAPNQAQTLEEVIGAGEAARGTYPPAPSRVVQPTTPVAQPQTKEFVSASETGMSARGQTYAPQTPESRVQQPTAFATERAMSRKPRVDTGENRDAAGAAEQMTTGDPSHLAFPIGETSPASSADSDETGEMFHGKHFEDEVDDSLEVTREGVAISVDKETERIPIGEVSGKAAALRDFTFDNFVVGNANQIAYEVARQAAEGDQLPGNPVFLYSKSGLGKTHLLLAIYNYINANRPDVRVVYATSNGFVEEYIDEIKNQHITGREVMKNYRTADVLLIDDVQFFKRKQESQIAFFDIFNQLVLNGKTIVLTADEAPDYLQLDTRIKTRFNSGILIDIGVPSYELKRNILQSYYDRKRAQFTWLQADLDADDLDYVAELAPNNIREMQGFLTKIMMLANRSPERSLSRMDIKRAHDEQFQAERQTEISVIIRVVAGEYGVQVKDISGQTRTKVISEARQVSMWLARQMTDNSYSAIGEWFNRDHSTVYNSIAKIDKIAQEDRSFMDKLERLKRAVLKRDPS